MLHAVVMAGGAGTRFWPASRQDRPKQLLDLAGDRTMIRATVDRFAEWIPPQRTLVVTNRRLVPAMREQLSELPAEAVLGEPCKRDTAPCVGVAAAWVAKFDPEAVMVVAPADHVISPVAEFRRLVEAAAEMVERDADRIVTFGIKPSYPAESFGYIQRGEPLKVATADAFRVAQFREKPKADVARAYLADGGFYWNAGIFVWKAQTILEQLRLHEPEMFARIEAIQEAIGTPAFSEVFQSEFASIVGKSIDYAVMERATDVAVIEATFDWDDVGSWQALARLRGGDEHGNTCAGHQLAIDTRDCIIRGEPGHLIVTLGLQDCLVVQTEGATLVANKHDEERIREVVEQLKKRGLDQHL